MTNEPTSMDFEIDKTVGNEGEYGVKFNEPTTGEIVRAMGNPETLDQESLYYWSKVAADRLESQEQKIAEIENFHKEMLKDHKAQIDALTARAESTEAERDAAIKDLEKMIGADGSCFGCAHDKEDFHPKYCGMTCKPKWRGLQPQDGGMK